MSINGVFFFFLFTNLNIAISHITIKPNLSFQEKIHNAKDRITDLIRENTDKLDQLSMLLGEKKTYEKALDARQKNLVRIKHSRESFFEIFLFMPENIIIH